MSERAPGTYYCEIEVAAEASVTADVLEQGLRAMGWALLAVDRAPIQESPTRYAFVGRLERTFRPRDNALIAWRTIESVAADVFLAPKLAVQPFDLFSNVDYHLRFAARTKEHPDRASVRAELEAMGFRVEHVSALRTHDRLPDRPTIDVGWWYARAAWRRGDTTMTHAEPFYFEDVAPDELPSASGEQLENLLLENQQP